MRRSFVLVLAALIGASPAAAQPNEPTDDDPNKPAADRLFHEGKSLIDNKQDYRAACPKFEQSLELLDQLGVRMNLADCYEHHPRLLAARNTFIAAEQAAIRLRDSRLSYIRTRLSVLNRRLPTLTIVLAPGTAPDAITVTLDSQTVARAVLGKPFAVDPGSHDIRATARGGKDWSTRIQATEASHTTVKVPPLDADA